MNDLFEIRLDPQKVAGETEYWALYATSFYEKLFGKMDDPNKIESMYTHLKKDPRLKERDKRALRFFYELRMDELEEGEKELWDMILPKRKNVYENKNKNMKAKLVKESLNEYYGSNDPDDALDKAKQEAREISRKEGVVQHVNEIRPGVYRVEDWYDYEQTVVSYENGMQL